MWIPSAEASIPDKLDPQECLELCGYERDDVVDTLGMKVPTEPLEVA